MQIYPVTYLPPLEKKYEMTMKYFLNIRSKQTCNASRTNNLFCRHNIILKTSKNLHKYACSRKHYKNKCLQRIAKNLPSTKNCSRKYCTPSHHLKTKCSSIYTKMKTYSKICPYIFNFFRISILKNNTSQIQKYAKNSLNLGFLPKSPTSAHQNI